jgi:xanthine dehydrogenase YagT iron-sulfur-binding subunit
MSGPKRQARKAIAISDPPAAVAAPVAPTPAVTMPEKVSVTFNVNGVERTLAIEPWVTLLDAFREHLGLTGPKKGCDRGQCGACTVLLDDRRINSCLALAVAHQGARLTTIEGCGTADSLHPVQRAFIAHDAFQCGYCTPGQICSAIAMLQEARDGWPSAVTADLNADQVTLDAEEIRERMSGNLCRCGAYANIVSAVEEVAR